MLFRFDFLQVKDVCPVDLQMKQVILSSEKNMWNFESFAEINNELGNFGMSSYFMYICRRKLRIWSYSSANIPALRWLI